MKDERNHDLSFMYVHLETTASVLCFCPFLFTSFIGHHTSYPEKPYTDLSLFVLQVYSDPHVPQCSASTLENNNKRNAMSKTSSEVERKKSPKP